MGKKKVRFCYRVPPFPESAFIVLVWFDFSQQIIPLPLSFIFTDIEDAKKHVHDTQKKSQTQKDMLDQILIIPIKLKSLFLNKKEFWTDDVVAKDLQERIVDFAQAVDAYDKYKLLATTAGVHDGKEYFQPLMTFSQKAEDSDMENYMRSSDAYVDPTAKYSAIYSLGKPFTYNINTRQIYISND